MVRGFVGRFRAGPLCGVPVGVSPIVGLHTCTYGGRSANVPAHGWLAGPCNLMAGVIWGWYFVIGFHLNSLCYAYR